MPPGTAVGASISRRRAPDIDLGYDLEETPPVVAVAPGPTPVSAPPPAARSRASRPCDPPCTPPHALEIINTDSVWAGGAAFGTNAAMIAEMPPLPEVTFMLTAVHAATALLLSVAVAREVAPVDATGEPPPLALNSNTVQQPAATVVSVTVSDPPLANAAGVTYPRRRQLTLRPMFVWADPTVIAAAARG
jgi:hypothetical protein